ncbi:MAG: MBL fold metallo-hydrolase [Treponema sp.]|jgi:glyoxylase-like metal-dependent hydrolase (beta-lactamase superfamily II)|nr:MBL fold metallo-hydrolase [Treponema sp.]
MKEIHNIVVGGISANCWIYGDAVIDPGEEGDRILAFLDQLKLSPKHILLTHGHLDHIGAVPTLAERYGASAEIAIHAADAEYLGPDSYSAHRESFLAAAGTSIYVDSFWKDMPPHGRLLAEGDTVGPFTVLHLPGHTPGSIGLWDQEAGILFSGDTLFCAGVGRTDLPGGSEKQLYSSLKRLFAMDSSIRVFPGHGPATSIGREAGLN